MSEQQADKRLHPRIQLKQRCWCESPGTTMYVSMLNLSSGGAFLQTAVPLPVGQKATVRWKLDSGEEIEAQVEVVWTHDGNGRAPGMGLRFVQVVHGEGRLAKFLASAIDEPNAY
jgi:uncharacterized protein (TIGR02266 family)